MAERIDSRAVARSIRDIIWPLLRCKGFTQFSSRTAWRYSQDQIHVVNYQSFNRYLADGLSCTPFSFSINLGKFFRAIPLEDAAANGLDPALTPQEWRCHFRHHMLKGIDQHLFPRRDIWSVEYDGRNLPSCLVDSRTALDRDGLPWFDRFDSMELVLSLLVDQEQLPEVLAARNSPARNRMIGYIAQSIGRTDLAGELISKAESEIQAIHARVHWIGRNRNRNQQ